MKSLDYAGLKQLVSTEVSYVVEDLIAAHTVNIFVGDSGLGKTPLLVQMALCVAAGLPFLGLRTRPGLVLYADYENSADSIFTMIEDMSEFFGIEPPTLFRRYQCPPDVNSLAAEIRALKPTLVIVDALRGLDPTAEKENSNAAGRIAYLQKLAHECNTSFLLLHHLKKNNSEDAPEPLALAPSFMEWMERTSGARALINQTDARVGIDLGTAETDLVMRWHFKTQGESGLWRIRRMISPEHGYPVAYERIIGPQLLRTDSDRTLYTSLPDIFFRFSECAKLSHRNDKLVAKFLRDCISAGILSREGRRKDTRYRKIAPSTRPVFQKSS